MHTHIRMRARTALLALGLLAGGANSWAVTHFDCSPGQFQQLRPRLEALLNTWTTPAQAWRWDGQVARLRQDGSSTLNLATQWSLPAEPFDRGPGMGTVDVTSRAEIALALMAVGRVRNYPCLVKAFEQEVGLRQSVVGWASVLEWHWPDGESAQWNKRLWDQGSPLGGKAGAVAALRDAFEHQSLYSIGCYTATKLVYAQAYLDYYARKRPQEFPIALEALATDGDPLVDVEPGRSWSFEDGFDPKDWSQPGKILRLAQVAAEGFVPGDWAYLLNTDAESAQKTGYEGSNAIYLGGGRFGDFYNDNNHSYFYQEKLDEVWQWRHGVFSRARDADKVQPLSAEDFKRLGRTPQDGGLVLSWRAFPLPVAELAVPRSQHP